MIAANSIKYEKISAQALLSLILNHWVRREADLCKHEHVNSKWVRKRLSAKRKLINYFRIWKRCAVHCADREARKTNNRNKKIKERRCFQRKAMFAFLRSVKFFDCYARAHNLFYSHGFIGLTFFYSYGFIGLTFLRTNKGSGCKHLISLLCFAP